MNELEQRLNRQSPRPIPPEWRAEILSAAHEAQAAQAKIQTSPRSRLNKLHDQISALFWPQPKAWAGLAAAWIFIVAVHVALSDAPVKPLAKVAPSSPDVVLELKNQQRLLAELVGSYEPRTADRQRKSPARPRSQCEGFQTA